MKRFLSILLCAVMLLSLLAGCGKGDDTTAPTEHKHTYASEWSTNETSHWYQATCEHSTLQANFGEHVDDNLDAICDICGYESTACQHTYSEAWSSDAQFHWHAATCNHIGSVSEKAEHADEDNDGACDVCAYMGEHEHTFEEQWSNNESHHWHEATCDHDVVADAADHVDESNDGECDVCGWFDPDHTHTFSEEFTCDVTYHWFSATCEHLGAISEKAQHADTDENGHCDTCDYLMCQHVDYDLDGECDTCGGPLDPDHVHTFGSETGSDTTGHWFISDCHPGAFTEVEEHLDENNDGVCDICAFQTCGHSYAATWTSNDTHHWHAILCTCSIERKDYAQHVDADSDGGCDVCMYGLPVEAVYETILDNASITLTLDKMITYTPFTVNFPQPGKYVITPNRGDLDIRVWLTDGSDYGAEDAFFNSGGALTVEVEEAGEMTMWFRMFSWTYGADVTHELTYSVVRMDDLVMETMQGKVELPANTIYVAKFVAQELGTYKLITGVDGLVIGKTEASMEYYKGHIELVVTEIGQEFTLYLLYEDESVNSFIFDWRLEPPFCLSVGEGNFAVDVAPNQVDYKIEFTAPTDGYFLMQVHSPWLTFAQMGDVHTVPVRLETMEVLTPYMLAGDTYTIWLQTVYDYPEATNVYDTLTVSNVGEMLNIGSNTVLPGAEGSRYCFQAAASTYYRIEVSGGELGVIAPNGSISWTSDAYEVNLTMDQTYSFMLRGSGNVTVNVSAVDYSMDLFEGSNTITMEPNKYYSVIFKYTKPDGSVKDMSLNSSVALNWEGNLLVFVNGKEYTRGSTIMLLDSKVEILLKNNGAANVKINVTLVDDADIRDIVEGSSNAELFLHQVVTLAVNRDSDGATAYYTAEIGGTYTLQTFDSKAVVYVVSANGTQTVVLNGAGTYSFNLNVGETITFFVDSSDGSMMSIDVLLTPGS